MNMISLSITLLLLAANVTFAAAAAAAASTPAVKRRHLPSHFPRPWGVTSSRNSMPPEQTNQSPRRIVMMGGPASGKGTQCEYITKEYGLVHLSTGDMLRAAVSRDTSPGSIGALAKDYMDRGMLVPDKVIVQLVKDRISQRDCQERGFLLDGFPRTAPQARAMIELGIEIDSFIFIDVPDELLVERVVGRRLDPVTGKIYHLKYNPPSKDITDRLITRSDDTEAKARNRLLQFHANASTVKRFFLEKMTIIDGRGKPNEVAESIAQVLKQRANQCRA